MTVGIVFSNGLEAALLCDEILTIVSASGNSEDRVTKLGMFEHSNYHGAMVCAGEGNFSIGGITAFSTDGRRPNNILSSTENLDDLVKEVVVYVTGKLDADDDEWLTQQLANARKKSKKLGDGEEAKRFFEAERDRIFKEFDSQKEHQMHAPPVHFLMAAYDKQRLALRVLSILGQSVDEIHLPHHEIGGGANAARLYFAETMHGIDASKLKTSELAFYTACAFMRSTVELGVGGTPKMVFARKEGVNHLSGPAVSSLTNSCGYYLAGALTKPEVQTFARDLIEATLSTENGALLPISKLMVEELVSPFCAKLRTTLHDMVSASLPLRVIYQRVNNSAE